MQIEFNDSIELSNVVIIDYVITNSEKSIMEVFKSLGKINVKLKQPPYFSLPTNMVYDLKTINTSQQFDMRIFLEFKDIDFDTFNSKEFQNFDERVTSVSKRSYFNIQNLFSVTSVVQKTDEAHENFIRETANSDLCIGDDIYHQITKTDIIKVKILSIYSKESE